MRQRVALTYHLGALTREDTLRYVPHRLKAAAGAGCVVRFSPEALELVYQSTLGVPRMINVLCDNALLAGYARGEQSIGRDGRAGDAGDDDVGPARTRAGDVQRNFEPPPELASAEARAYRQAANEQWKSDNRLRHDDEGDCWGRGRGDCQAADGRQAPNTSGDGWPASQRIPRRDRPTPGRRTEQGHRPDRPVPGGRRPQRDRCASCGRTRMKWKKSMNVVVKPQTDTQNSTEQACPTRGPHSGSRTAHACQPRETPQFTPSRPPFPAAGAAGHAVAGRRGPAEGRGMARISARKSQASNLRHPQNKSQRPRRTQRPQRTAKTNVQ